jgi:hypothetical protein
MAGVVVTLPPGTSHCWHMVEHGSTQLTRGAVLTVPAAARVKVAVFAAAGDKYVPVGVAVFETGKGGAGAVPLRWPSSSTAPSATPRLSDRERTVRVAGGAIDLFAGMRAELVAANSPALGGLSGMNKFWKVDWEWPFRTPGWTGLREIGQPPPGYIGALPWLQYHALSCMGRASKAECTDGEWKSVVSMALGATGYLDGYDHEEVDDTAALWCSFGTGNDCDDFAMATCALVQAVLAAEGPPVCDLDRWVRTHCTDAYVVSGWAWPRNAMHAGRPRTFGHMWCEVVLADGEVMVVECTSAVAYYGGVPTASGARVGIAQGPKSEYLTREYHWYADRAYRIDSGGARHLLPAPVMPSWYNTLRLAVPAARSDPAYTPPPPPPPPTPAAAFWNSRQHAGAGVVCQRLWPFRHPESVVNWGPGPLTTTPKLGAYS